MHPVVARVAKFPCGDDQQNWLVICAGDVAFVEFLLNEWGYFSVMFFLVMSASRQFIEVSVVNLVSSDYFADFSFGVFAVKLAKRRKCIKALCG